MQNHEFSALLKVSWHPFIGKSHVVALFQNYFLSSQPHFQRGELSGSIIVEANGQGNPFLMISHSQASIIWPGDLGFPPPMIANYPSLFSSPSMPFPLLHSHSFSIFPPSFYLSLFFPSLSLTLSAP